MAAKAVQGVVSQISALSPAFLVRVGSRGYSKILLFLHNSNSFLIHSLSDLKLSPSWFGNSYFSEFNFFPYVNFCFCSGTTSSSLTNCSRTQHCQIFNHKIQDAQLTYGRNQKSLRSFF